MPPSDFNAAKAEYLRRLRMQAEAAANDAARNLLVNSVPSAVYLKPDSIGKDFSFKARIDKKFAVFLYRLGRYLQRTAKNSIRPRNKGRRKVDQQGKPEGIPSAPYTPPRIPLYRRTGSPLRELIMFAMDGDELVAGPKIFQPSPGLRVKPRGNDTIAAVLEHGGRQTMRLQTGESKLLTYEPRPFMSLALLRAMKSKTFQHLLAQIENL